MPCWVNLYLNWQASHILLLGQDINMMGDGGEDETTGGRKDGSWGLFRKKVSGGKTFEINLNDQEKKC